jgi:hypothetical protein
MARLIARIRMPVLLVVLIVLLTQPWTGLRTPWWLACIALVGAMALYARIGRVRCASTAVAPPVRGRWRAVNSPADRVPSHGIHAYGQTYAIDLVYEPAGRPTGGVTGGRLACPPTAFPGFGQPVYAVAPGRVVRVRQGQRDHWSRTSAPALLYLIVESMVRELFGAGRVVGNHVVVDHGGGRYALYAHLQRGSVGVRAGQHVQAGEQIARCGNSGNSSEPHVHFQIMDRSRPTFAAGLPFRFTGPVDGDLTDGVPRTGTRFVVGTLGSTTHGSATATAPVN